MNNPMNKLHFGCSGFKLPGWINTDLPQVDIRKPLPWPDSSASHIYASHVIEHVSPQEAWNFLAECRRVLAPGGIVRLAFPDFSKLSSGVTDEYCLAVKNGGHGDGSPASALKAMVFEHGHESVWTASLMAAFMEGIGLKAVQCVYGYSDDAALRGLEHHGKIVGETVARLETSIVEGTKPSAGDLTRERTNTH